jgi:hypothetical protein
MAIKTFSDAVALPASDINTYLTNGGLVYINQFTLSGGTTNLTSIFSSTYDNYRLIVSGASTTSAVIDTFQMLNGTTPATGGNYNRSRWTASVPATPSLEVNQTAGYQITTGTTPTLWTIEIGNPFLAAKTTLNSFGQYGGNSDLSYPEMLTSIHTLTTSYDGISFIATGTTWTAGKVTVYGYRKP